MNNNPLPYMGRLLSGELGRGALLRHCKFLLDLSSVLVDQQRLESVQFIDADRDEQLVLSYISRQVDGRRKVRDCTKAVARQMLEWLVQHRTSNTRRQIRALVQQYNEIYAVSYRTTVLACHRFSVFGEMVGTDVYRQVFSFMY